MRPLYDSDAYLKRAEDAHIRRVLYWPKLARTTDHLILMRPSEGHRRGFAHYVKHHLPAFRFDSQHDRWQAALDPTIYHDLVTRLTRRNERELHVSPGVTAWAGEDPHARQ